MKTNDIAIQTADIVEQIISVNQMIDLHEKSPNTFMLKQYQYRRTKLLASLKELFEPIAIDIVDLAA